MYIGILRHVSFILVIIIFAAVCGAAPVPNAGTSSIKTGSNNPLGHSGVYLEGDTLTVACNVGMELGGADEQVVTCQASNRMFQMNSVDYAAGAALPACTSKYCLTK